LGPSFGTREPQGKESVRKTDATLQAMTEAKEEMTKAEDAPA